MIIVHARNPESNSQPLCGRELSSGDVFMDRQTIKALVDESKCECGVTFHVLDRYDLTHDCADCDNLLADNTTSSENAQPVNLTEEQRNAKSWAEKANQEAKTANAKVERLAELEYYLRLASQYLEPGETYSLPGKDIHVTRM